MNKNSIIFLSLAQNCSLTLKNYFNFLEKFPKSFKIKFIIAENNSKDNTRKILDDYSKINKDMTLIKADFLNRVEERILRITKGRHFLKNYIIKKKLKSEFVCVIDLDNVLKQKIELKNFFQILKDLRKNKKELNGISVKSNPYYYDILALKCDRFNLPNILNIQRDKNIFSAYNIRKKHIYSIQKKVNSEKKLNTISSFNGLCVYNYNDFILGDYFYGEKNKKKATFNEHIKFNLSLYKKNGKFIRISDKLYLSTPKEHFPPKNLFEFCLDKFLFKLIGNK